MGRVIFSPCSTGTRFQILTHYLKLFISTPGFLLARDSMVVRAPSHAWRPYSTLRYSYIEFSISTERTIPKSKVDVVS